MRRIVACGVGGGTMDNEFARREWQQTLAGWHRLCVMLVILTSLTGFMVLLFWRSAFEGVVSQVVRSVMQSVG